MLDFFTVVSLFLLLQVGNMNIKFQAPCSKFRIVNIYVSWFLTRVACTPKGCNI